MNKIPIKYSFIILLLGVGGGILWGKAELHRQELAVQRQQNQLLVQYNLLLTLLYAGRADGQLTANTSAAIIHIFQDMGYSESDMGQVKMVMETMANHPFDINAVTQNVKNGTTDVQRKALFKNAYIVASADGPLSAAKQEALTTIYKNLN